MNNTVDVLLKKETFCWYDPLSVQKPIKEIEGLEISEKIIISAKKTFEFSGKLGAIYDFFYYYLHLGRYVKLKITDGSNPDLLWVHVNQLARVLLCSPQMIKKESEIEKLISTYIQEQANILQNFGQLKEKTENTIILAPRVRGTYSKAMSQKDRQDNFTKKRLIKIWRAALLAFHTHADGALVKIGGKSYLVATSEKKLKEGRTKLNLHILDYSSMKHKPTGKDRHVLTYEVMDYGQGKTVAYREVLNLEGEQNLENSFKKLEELHSEGKLKGAENFPKARIGRGFIFGASRAPTPADIKSLSPEEFIGFCCDIALVLKRMDRLRICHGNISPENFGLKKKDDQISRIFLRSWTGAPAFRNIKLDKISERYPFHGTVSRNFMTKKDWDDSAQLVYNYHHAPETYVIDKLMRRGKGGVGALYLAAKTDYNEIQRQRDVLALGIWLYTMLTGKAPFATKTTDDFVDLTKPLNIKLLNEALSKYKPEAQALFIDLITKMLKDNYLERPTYTEVFNCFEKIKLAQAS